MKNCSNAISGVPCDWPYLLRRGLGDIVQALARREVWMYLGVQEVRKQYRRSILGPFWLTLNMGILVGALGWFYSQIFGQNIAYFLPYVSLGFIFWGLIGGLLNESCLIYTASAASIRQTAMPLSVYAYQLVWRQLVIFAHNFSIFVIVALVFGIWPGATGLLVIPGFLLLLVNGFFLGLILGPLGTRFRDIPPIMASVTQILFFLTPVFWVPSSLPERAVFIATNPFYHFLAVVRQPLLGEVPTGLNWGVCLILTTANAALATFFFSRFRSRIPYWA
ncbi:MAG: ABC transporter permease [Rhodospirillaceae bacterium]|nr:ABC transporter permease [Rhodospirillaceae bacterium]